jgi:GTP-binding protein HflX
VLVENKLFATLDPTTRIVPLSPSSAILMTDTVGFIRKLPHHLVAAFKSTLEEVTEADLLLHVVDLLSPLYEDQIRVVQETLEDLGAADKTTLLVFNKIDRLNDRSIISALSEKYPQSVCISAMRGINIVSLKEKIQQLVNTEFVEETIVIPQSDPRLISAIYDFAEVLDRSYEDNSVHLIVRVPRKDLEHLRAIIGK